MKEHLTSLITGLPADEQKEELIRLVDLIYGSEKTRFGVFKNLNGIRAKDDYIMARIYFEANFENLFIRKKSNFKSYQPPDDDLNKIETQNIPVFSFRYKTPFCKS